jgi:ketosteroid isomerase-like protein
MACLSLLLLAMACRVGAPAQNPVSDEATVRSLDDQERIAALTRDVPTLERLWSDQFTVNAPNNEVLIGKPAVLDWVHRGIINFSSFDRTIEFIRVDGDLAIIMGAEAVQPIGDAPAAGQMVRRRFTNIWRKEGGTWRLFARHANVIPPR